jgi:hypothetical protein
VQLSELALDDPRMHEVRVPRVVLNTRDRRESYDVCPGRRRRLLLLLLPPCEFKAGGAGVTAWHGLPIRLRAVSPAPIPGRPWPLAGRGKGVELGPRARH